MKDTVQYVPLLESLQSLLRHPEIRDEVGCNLILQHDIVQYYNILGTSTSDNIIADFCDGLLHKSHFL